ncbi:PD-(D/E)XK nuclease family transposase [uncultured Thiodictyon sp.]|uniref:PD-(D/E)XK nuclease family transposase n=1 Tax=uncultured Thiodictyon sp. TaxID=1846217 RepID=UPI0025D81C79|nr:PD-(D/E)XK nuclease family transposase [uncultured Thiodictyon sp.]
MSTLPTCAIPSIPNDPEYAHEFRLRDRHGRVFLDHGGIWLLELSKFAADAVETEQQRWLKFFNEAERLNEDALPAWMQTQEMRRAMNTLKAFSEQEHAYHAYQARQDYLREQQSIQLEFADLRAEVEQARADAMQERAAAEQARASAEHERAAKEQERAAKEQEQAAKEQARAAAEQERVAKEEALAENERLKRLLADKSASSGPGMR